MSSYSDDNTFEDILDRLLENVDDTLDKRQGSIIYDALAPAAAELAQCYVALDVYADQSYLLTATGENLDNRVADYGITRNEATAANRIILVTDTDGEAMSIDVGTKFAIPNESGGYTFTTTLEVAVGKYLAECDTTGTAGNEYVGDVLPVQSINNLGTATIDTVFSYGEDEETDDELRDRVIEKITAESFAGNKSDYKSITKEIDGVELCKVFPVWNGGGTVKLVIVGDDLTIPSSTIVSNVQTIIDPTTNQGEGMGKAPIGHTVTVEAATKLDITISATITLADNYTVAQVQDSIKEYIEAYILEVQNNWEDESTLLIYSSKIIAAILSVPQVKNVSNLLINEASGDYTINVTSTSTQFPILSGVTLNAG